MSNNLDEIVSEYRTLSNIDYSSKFNNPILRELEKAFHGVKFVLTKYFRDDKIKELRKRHTKAVLDDLIEVEKVPFNLAVKLSKAIPLPVDAKGAKAIICVLYGYFGPGRVQHTLFKHASKYSGLEEKWLFRGSIFAELTSNNWTGAVAISALTYPLESTFNYVYNQVTGDNTYISLTKILAYSHIFLSHAESIKHFINYEYSGKYRSSKMLWTRFPSVLMYYASHRYDKTIKKNKNFEKK